MSRGRMVNESVSAAISRVRVGTPDATIDPRQNESQEAVECPMKMPCTVTVAVFVDTFPDAWPLRRSEHAAIASTNANVDVFMTSIGTATAMPT